MPWDEVTTSEWGKPMDLIPFLKAHPAFEGLDEGALERLAQRAQVLQFESGELILASGAPGEIFGVIHRGRAEAVVGHGTPRRRFLNNIEEGEVFGEISLMTGESTLADVVAVTPVEAVLIPSDVSARRWPRTLRR